MSIEIRRLSPDLCEDWLTYFDGIAFGDHGEWALCYCLEGHMTRQENDGLKNPAARRDYAKQLIQDGKMQGYLAYADGKVVGWCNANDRSAYTYLDELYAYMNYKPDDKRTKVVFCFLVASNYRGQGIAGAFLDRVCQDAKNDGYEQVEAYPLSDTNSEFQYHGTLRMYEKNGFKKNADFQFVNRVVKELGNY